MKIRHLIVAASLAAGGGAAVGHGEASALSSCTGSWNAGTMQWSTRCIAGSGQQRAWANAYSPGAVLTTFYGPWKIIYQYSTATINSTYNPTGDRGYDTTL